MKIRLMLLAFATACGALAVAAPVDAQPLPGETLPAWTHTASSCEVDEESNGRYTLTGPDFSYKGGMQGGPSTEVPALMARCNVANPLDSGNPAWNRLIVTYRDTDLGCPFNRVVVKLFRVPRVPSTTRQLTLIATFNSDTVSEGCQEIFFGSMTEDAVAFSHQFDFLNNAYHVEIQLFRLDNEFPPPIARMVRLARVEE
jgi:hypothetical protein